MFNTLISSVCIMRSPTSRDSLCRLAEMGPGAGHPWGHWVALFSAVAWGATSQWNWASGLRGLRGHSLSLAGSSIGKKTRYDPPPSPWCGGEGKRTQPHTREVRGLETKVLAQPEPIHVPRAVKRKSVEREITPPVYSTRFRNTELFSSFKKTSS